MSENRLYFSPDYAELLSDTSVPVVLVEAKKSALAVSAWAQRNGRRLLVVSARGCWGGGDRISDEIAGVDQLEETDFDVVAWRARGAFILFSSNAPNSEGCRPRFMLADELERRGANVHISFVVDPDGTVNGCDDLGVWSDLVIANALETAVLVPVDPVNEAASAIQRISTRSLDLPGEELGSLFRTLARVDDPARREILINEAKKALPSLPKQVIRDEVNACRTRQAKASASAQEKSREVTLRQVPVDGARLIEGLEAFFNDRAYLPEDAGLVLAYLTLNTYTYDAFDTTPYVCLESATPGCGKSTVLRLISAVARNPQTITAMTEAVMFRLIDREHPTLLIDEAEIIESRSERAEVLRAIANEGYKLGGTVPRCEGENHDVRLFNVYCPKVFAAVGGLRGALLDRCMVIHMEKAPKGGVRKSTRNRALRRDANDLVTKLEAYALQNFERLRELYDAEPDSGYWASISDREAELWGPLLTHAKIAGPEAEIRLLKVIDHFGEQKAEIQSADWYIDQTIDLLDAITKHPESTFTPGDLVPTLSKSEAWAKTFGEVKGREADAVRVGKAARVGYFLRKFRLRRKKKNAKGQIVYDRRAAIVCLSAHVPQNPPNSPDPPLPKAPETQPTKNRASPGSTEGTGYTSPEGSGE